MSEAISSVDPEIQVESERIMRTGAIWTAAALIAPALFLGPLLAEGWRPASLAVLDAVVWWIGFAAAAIGLALLMWAGCPVPAFTPERAHRQKVFSIRVGIVMYLCGAALVALTLLLT